MNNVNIRATTKKKNTNMANGTIKEIKMEL